jgi:GTP cyclohydrolase II
MLHALGIHRCRLITNNPDKVRQLTANGIKVVECVRTGVFVNANNYRYLAAKKHRAQHVIELPVVEVADSGGCHDRTS